MGYETKLIFVTANKKKEGRPVGYCRVEAELEMGKIGGYGEIDVLLTKATEVSKKLKTEYGELVDTLKEGEKEMFNSEGDYTEEYSTMKEKVRDREYNKMIGIPRRKLDKVLPYVYDGDDQAFEDAYGDFLLVVGLKELKEAIIKDNASEIAKGNYELGYRRFNIALKLIEGFEHDFGEEVLVVMWGH